MNQKQKKSSLNLYQIFYEKKILKILDKLVVTNDPGSNFQYKCCDKSYIEENYYVTPKSDN